MKFIQIKHDKRCNSTYAVFREKTAKYGDDLNITTIKKKTKTILLVGGADSKQGMSSASREMLKLYNRAADLWGRQQQPYAHTKCNKKRDNRLDNKPMENKKVAAIVEEYEPPQPLYYDCGEALAGLRSDDNIIAWYEQQHGEGSHKHLKAAQKDKVILDYLQETRAILFLDNVDKLNSHTKIKLVEQMYTRAFRRVMTCKDEKRIPPELRLNLNYADENRIQRFMLNSEASTDVTDWLILTLVTGGSLAAMGSTGGMSMLFLLLFMLGRQGKGKFATRE